MRAAITFSWAEVQKISKSWNLSPISLSMRAVMNFYAILAESDCRAVRWKWHHTCVQLHARVFDRWCWPMPGQKVIYYFTQIDCIFCNLCIKVRWLFWRRDHCNPRMETSVFHKEQNPGQCEAYNENVPYTRIGPAYAKLGETRSKFKFLDQLVHDRQREIHAASLTSPQSDRQW